MTRHAATSRRLTWAAAILAGVLGILAGTGAAVMVIALSGGQEAAIEGVDG